MTHLLDVLMTVGVVWTLGPLHWIALGYVFDALVFPDDYNWAMITSCVVGYAAVLAFTLMQDAAKRASLRYDQQQRSVSPLHGAVDWNFTAHSTPFSSPTGRDGSRKNIWGGGGPSSFGRQQRLTEITIKPTRLHQTCGKVKPKYTEKI